MIITILIYFERHNELSHPVTVMLSEIKSAHSCLLMCLDGELCRYEVKHTELYLNTYILQRGLNTNAIVYTLKCKYIFYNTKLYCEIMVMAVSK